MLRRRLPGVDITVSRFSFGTASLHHLASEADRQRLLFAAHAAGFSHFDTSPLYGFGIAERSLKPLLRAHPEITVATKVGLYPPGGADQPPTLMLARKIAGKLAPSLSRAKVDWSVGRARQSFESSLKRLGRERVDLLFLHEPEIGLIATDEWLLWLEDIKSRYRAIGVSGGKTQVAPFLAGELATVVQTADSLERREADIVLDAGRKLQITYGYVSAARDAPAESTLARALERNASGSILVSTRRLDRVDQYARLAGQE